MRSGNRCRVCLSSHADNLTGAAIKLRGVHANMDLRRAIECKCLGQISILKSGGLLSGEGAMVDSSLHSSFFQCAVGQVGPVFAQLGDFVSSGD